MAMPTDVIMPQMGESIFEGTLTKWLKKPGDKVTRDEPLFEISTDKVDAEIPAPASGVLKEVKVAEGTTVQVNTVVGVIDAEGSAAAAAPPKPAVAPPAPPAPQKKEPTPPQAKPAFGTGGDVAKSAAKTTGGAAATDGPAVAQPRPAAPPEQATQPKAAAPQGQGPGTNVVMPQMGESIFEGTLTKWLKNVGDKVTRDEPLFEISTDKVDAEIPAPASGVLSEIKVQAGTTVQVNTVVGVIGGAAAGVAAPAAAQPRAGDGRKGEAARAGGGVTQQREGEEETEIPTTLRGRAEVEPAARPGEQQAVARQADQVITFPAVDRDQNGRRIRSSPLVRRIARDNQINLGTVPGTGLGGRISKNDILGYIQQHGAGTAPAAERRVAGPPAAATVPPRAAAPQAPAIPMQAAPPVAAQPRAAAPQVPTVPMQAPPAGAPITVGAEIPDEVVPLSIMRRKIAEHMVASRRTSAHVHAMFEVDMTRIVNLRAKTRKDWEARNGGKLTFMPFFARAVVLALRQWPIVNSSMTEEAIHYHKHVNLGIAVALENGLIVPVVKHCEERSFVGLQRGISDVGERARSKKLKPEEVQGSTFTITNPGQFGAVFGLPIINQPNVAIMGVGGITKTPLVITDEEGNDNIAIRSVVHLTLGYDHRVIDGAVADQFMAQVKKNLEGWSEDIG
jgi:2-oxoglutarate dehydrogenase E2 component (dihydrolipoamide succinyltransferase)